MRSSRRSSPSRRAIVGLVPAVVLVVAAVGACSPDLQTRTGGVPPTPEITDAWVRLPMGGSDMTAAYMTIRGASRDVRLVSATSPSATSVTLHQTTTDASGTTGMSEVTEIRVPASATVRLEPGGYHLMLEGLKAPLNAGSRVELNLVFDDGVSATVQAEVRAG